MFKRSLTILIIVTLLLSATAVWGAPPHIPPGQAKKALGPSIIPGMPHTTIELVRGSNVVLINGISKKMKEAPFMENGRMMIPIRFLSEFLDCEVVYDQKEKAIYVKTPKDEMFRLYHDKNSVEKWTGTKYEPIELNGVPKLKFNRVFIPIRFLKTLFGFEIKYNSGRIIVDGGTKLPDEIVSFNVYTGSIIPSNPTVQGVEPFEVDNSLLLFVKAGQRNSGGHTLTVKDIRVKDNKLIVTAVERAPLEGTGVTMALQNVYQGVLIPLKYKDYAVELKLEKEIYVPITILQNKSLKETVNREHPGYLFGKASNILQNLSLENLNKTALVVFRGQKTSGGYGIEIKDVLRDGNNTKVIVKLTDPPQGSFNITQITMPYDVVLLPENYNTGTIRFFDESGKGINLLNDTSLKFTNITRRPNFISTIDIYKPGVIVGEARNLLTNLNTLGLSRATPVMAIFLGERPSGGYSVEVTEITYNGNRTRIVVKETKPGENDIVTMALTYPYALVRLETLRIPQVFELVDTEGNNLLSQGSKIIVE